MDIRLKYNVDLPEPVSYILDQDFWIFDNLSGDMMQSVHGPVKFSSFVSIFIRKGECRGAIDLIQYEMKSPCIVNINTNQILQKEYVSEDFEASFIVMSPRMTDNLFIMIQNAGVFPALNRKSVVNVSVDDVESLSTLYSDMKRLAAVKTSNPYIYHALLHTMLSFFYCMGYKWYASDDNDASTSYGRITDRFFMILHQNFRKERFLDFYADKLKITSKHLSRTVKTQTGLTAVEWIERYVVLEAKVMLKSTDLTIQQIAEELNFSSQSFFGKYFKKVVGVSPKEFRHGLL